MSASAPIDAARPAASIRLLYIGCRLWWILGRYSLWTVVSVVWCCDESFLLTRRFYNSQLIPGGRNEPPCLLAATDGLTRTTARPTDLRSRAYSVGSERNDSRAAKFRSRCRPRVMR